MNSLDELKQRIVEYQESLNTSEEIIPDVGRIYTFNKSQYPSVTTVLSKTADKAGLDGWRNAVGAEEAEKQLQYACNRGSKFHHLIEKFFQGIPITEEEQIGPGYELFSRTKHILRGIEPLAIELPLYSDRLKTAGRVDLVGVDKKTQEIITFDWKSSRKPKKVEHIQDYFLQATAYSMMFFERLQVPIKRFKIIIGVEQTIAQKFERPVKEYVPQVIERFRNYHEKF